METETEYLPFSVRLATPEELPVFGFWSKLQGWNRGVDDEKYFYICSPNGLWVATTDLPDSERPDPPDGPYDSDPSIKTRHILAIVINTEHSETYLFGGNLIVRPEWRIHNVALSLCLTSVTNLNKVIACNSVLNLVGQYNRLMGFVPSFALINFCGAIKPESTSSAPKQPSPYKIVLASKVPLDSVMKLDFETFGCTAPTRRDFIAAWISRPQVGATAFCVQDENDKVVGMIATRPASRGVLVGPIIAPDVDSAVSLFHAVHGRIKGPLGQDPVFYFDAPDKNPGVMRLVQILGFVENSRLIRMYRTSEDCNTSHFSRHSLWGCVSHVWALSEYSENVATAIPKNQ